MNLLRHRALISVALTLSATIALLGLVLSAAVREARLADRVLESAAAQYARLAGLKAARGEIEAALRAVAATLERHTYPPSTDRYVAGTDLQGRVRASAHGAGLTVIGSHILELRSQEDLDEIRVSLKLEGSLEQLQQMLLSLARSTPTVVTDALVVHMATKADVPPQQLAVEATFSAMRLTR